MWIPLLRIVIIVICIYQQLSLFNLKAIADKQPHALELCVSIMRIAA